MPPISLMMVPDDGCDLEWMLNRFRRLIAELTHGSTARNCFEPWEIDILVDIQTCELPARRRLETLRQYERAVERQMDFGPGPPMKLSDFLIRRAQRRAEIEEEAIRESPGDLRSDSGR